MLLQSCRQIMTCGYLRNISVTFIGVIFLASFAQAKVQFLDLKPAEWVKLQLALNSSNPSFPACGPEVCIVCFDGIAKNPWNLWASAELILENMPRHVGVEGGNVSYFEYYVSDCAEWAHLHWQQAQANAPPMLIGIFSRATKWITAKALSIINGSSPVDPDAAKRPGLSIPLDPFKRTCVAIEPHFKPGLDEEPIFSTLLSIRYIDYTSALLTVLGLVFFLGSPALLSHSDTFEYFFYSSSSLLGIFLSVILVAIIVARYMPYRRPTLLAVGITGSSLVSSVIIARLSMFVQSYTFPVICYIVLSAAIGFGVSYYGGPPQSPRTRNLILWICQAIGIILMFAGTCNLPIVTVVLIAICVIIRYRAHLILIEPPFFIRRMWWRFFPYKRKYLSLEEYEAQGREETQRQLDQLRNFVNSPKCDPWAVIQRVNNPIEFAKFVSPNSSPRGPDNAAIWQRLGNGTPILSNGHAHAPRLNDIEDDDDLMEVDEQQDRISDDDD